MRSAFNPILILCCCSLLAIQLSGMHFHVSRFGQEAGVRVVHQHQVVSIKHSHDAQPDHHTVNGIHDHVVEVDVTSPDQVSTTWVKLIPVMIACVVAAIFSALSQTPGLTPLRSPAGVRRRERWRPQLRAPPVSH